MVKQIVHITLLTMILLSMRGKQSVQTESTSGVQTARSDIPQMTAESIDEVNAPPETMVVISAPIMATPEYEKIFDVDLSGEVQQYIAQICDEYSIETALVFAIIEVESGFNANAISKTHDYGLMQINKCNHKSYSKLLGITDFLDPKQNVLAGVHMLASLRDNYSCDTTDKMLMAYNMGYEKAKKLWDKGIVSSDYSRKILSTKNNFLN